MKNYIFLVGLPRSGNTLLGSLINQNPNVCLSGNSVLLDVLWELEKIKKGKGFLNFPDIESFENITKNVFENYYSRHKANTIIVRGSWGTPDNLNQIKQNITKKPKFILLYRPVVECLASFKKAGTSLSEEEMYSEYMDLHGMIHMNYFAMRNIIEQNEEHIFINYVDLVTKPVNTIKKIFNFIEEDYIPIRITDFEQFKSNNIFYDDNVLDSKTMHKIDTKEIKDKKIKIEDYLSKDTIDRCIRMDTLKNEQQTA